VRACERAAWVPLLAPVSFFFFFFSFLPGFHGFHFLLLVVFVSFCRRVLVSRVARPAWQVAQDDAAVQVDAQVSAAVG
jgi:hypothetical protein